MTLVDRHPVVFCPMMTNRLLRVTAALYALGFLVHTVDHLVRGQDPTPVALYWTGTLALVPVVCVAWLVARGHLLGSELAIGAGFSTAVAALAVHLPGDWGPLSEPFREGITWVDWGTLILLAATGVAFGLAGVATLGRRRPSAGAATGAA